MQNNSKEEFLSDISSEINSKNNILSQKKNTIHNNIAHFHQVSNDIHNRNQTLQSYTLNLIKMKQKIEKDQKSFNNLQNQKIEQYEKDISIFSKKLDMLANQKQQIKKEIDQKYEIKKEINQKIEDDEKMFSEIEKHEQSILKPLKDYLKLKSKLEQLYIIYNETQSHCEQFLDCVNSLDKDFDLAKKSKEILDKKQLKLKKQIASEKSKFIQQKTSILIQTQKERVKQDKFRKEKSKSLLLKEKYENDINFLINNQSQIINSLHFCNQKEVSSNQFPTIQRNLNLGLKKDIIRGFYTNKIYEKRESDIYLKETTTKEQVTKKLNELMSKIAKSRLIKNEIHSKINKENLSISQYVKEINYLTKEVEDTFMNEKVDSNNFPFIYDFLNDIKKLEENALNEIEKWKLYSNSPSKIEYMLNKWNQRISF